MPSLIDYIRKLQDFEYERSANAMLSAIAQMSKGQGSEVQALVTALEKKAKAITEASKIVSSEVYSQMLAGFRAEMNRVETLIRQTAPNIELSGARAANNSVTARLFYGTSQDMIDAGLDPTSAEAMAYFMQLVKDVGIPFEVPKPEDLVTKYSQSEEFYNHMDKWGDGYADYFDDAIRNGVREGWSPAKVARYARDMATNIPVNAAYTWTRTLQLQSYRDASAQMELLNGRFIEKKIRIAALDGRTCFPAGTKIKTPSGYKNIEDIKVGDSVISHKGINRIVTETMERNYAGGMSEIKAGNKELYCTEDHPILIRRGRHDYWEVAKNIIPGDKVFIFSNKGTDNLDHVSFAWSKIKLFATDNAGEVFPIALLPFGITSLRTTHIAGFRPYLGYENFKLLSANPTSFNNSFTTHIVTSSNISNLNYNIKVYNLEVENDESYIANDIVVHNCPACIALHGTEVPLGQSIRDHFNGRCDAIYVPAGGEMPEFMQAMSTPGNRQFVEWQNGTDWFDAQSDAYKKQVLGAGRFDLYQQGKFKLDADFVNWHEDDVFGAMPGAKPLKELKKQLDTDDKN